MKFKKLSAVIIGSISLLVSGDSYTSPRQVIVESSDYKQRFPEPDVAGVYPTPNMKVSQGFYFFNNFLNNDTSSFIKPSTGRLPSYVSSENLITENVVFYYPVVPQNKDGLLVFIDEDIIMLDKTKEYLKKDISQLLDESDEVNKNVRDSLINLCDVQINKLNALKSKLVNSDGQKGPLGQVFALSKEDDSIVQAVAILEASLSGPLPSVPPTKVEKNINNIEEYLKQSALNIVDLKSLISNSDFYLQRVPSSEDRRRLLLKRRMLIEKLNFLKLQTASYSEQLSNPLKQDVYEGVVKQSSDYSSLLNQSNDFFYDISLLAPLPLEFSRDFNKVPIIVLTNDGYGVSVMSPNDKYPVFLEALTVKADNGDIDATRAIVVLEAATQAVETRQRGINFSGLNLIGMLSSKAVKTTSEPPKPFVQTLPEPSQSPVVEVEEIEEILSSSPGGPRKLLEDQFEEVELIEQGSDEVQLVPISSSESSSDDEETMLQPGESNYISDKEVLEQVVKLDPYPSATYLCPTCEKSPSSSCYHVDGSPLLCYKSKCETRNCGHVAVYKADCSNVAYEGFKCGKPQCIDNGKCKKGKCVNYGCSVNSVSKCGNCNERTCGCNHQLPVVEGCVIKPPRCTFGNCNFPRITGLKCNKKEILPNVHLAAGECKTGTCVYGQSRLPKCVAGNCQKGTCVDGQCRIPKCKKGTCSFGQYYAPSCKTGDLTCNKVADGKCSNGYCNSPQCSNGEYIGFRCKASQSKVPTYRLKSAGEQSFLPRCKGFQFKPVKLVDGECKLPKLHGSNVQPPRCVDGKCVPPRLTGSSLKLPRLINDGKPLLQSKKPFTSSRPNCLVQDSPIKQSRGNLSDFNCKNVTTRVKNTSQHSKSTVCDKLNCKECFNSKSCNSECSECNGKSDKQSNKSYLNNNSSSFDLNKLNCSKCCNKSSLRTTTSFSPVNLGAIAESEVE